jgi:hypothetical protein
MPRPVATAPSYDGVFVGTTGEVGPGPALAREVEVSSVYRGGPPSEIVVETGQGGAGGVGNSCDFELPADRTLVFLVDSRDGTWTAQPCNPPIHPTPKLLAALEDRLGPPHQPHELTVSQPSPHQVDNDDPSAVDEPTSDDNGDLVPWAVAGGAALVLGAGVGVGVGLSRRRHSS